MGDRLMPRYLEMAEKSRARLRNKGEHVFYASLITEVTTICDQACKTCFRPPTAAADMDEGLMDTLFDYADDHFFAIFPTGGDPIRVFSRIMKNAAEHPDLAVIIGTHGLSVEDYMIREMKAAGNIIVVISIDGIDKTHNETRGQTYDKVIGFTERLRYNGVPFGVQTVANRKNIDQIVDNSIADLMEHIGAVTWSIQRYYPIGRDEDTMLELMPDPGRSRRLQQYRDQMRSHNPYSFQFASAEGRDGLKCSRELSITVDGHIVYCPFTPWSFGKIEADDADAAITKKLQAHVAAWRELVNSTEGFCPLYRNTQALIDLGESHAIRLYPLKGILDPESRIHQKYIANTA